MIKKLTSISAVTLLASTLTVNAATLEVYYEGKVNYISGNGAGYAVNDMVSGSLFINTDLAPADSYSSASVGLYDNSSYYNYYDTFENSDFVTGHADAGTRSYDQVSVKNDYSTLDYFNVTDGEENFYNNGQGNHGYSYDYLQVWAYDYIVDFITDDGIEQIFNFSTGDVKHMNGSIYSYGYTYENGVQTDYHNGYAYLSLSRLSVGAVSAVPEPATLALVTLGLAGIGFRKRRAMR